MKGPIPGLDQTTLNRIETIYQNKGNGEGGGTTREGAKRRMEIALSNTVH